MARVTVEDCLEYCKDRFYLVLSAADRARRLESGRDESMVDEDNDKPTVVALREIAKGYDVDQDSSEAAAREEEDRLAERFMAIKRGDAIADAMSLMPDESAMSAEAGLELSFSEHLKLATEAIDSLSAEPKAVDDSESDSDESDKKEAE